MQNGDWRNAVLFVFAHPGNNDPVKLLQDVISSPHPPYQGPNWRAWSNVRRQLVKAGLDDSTAVLVEEAFGGSGSRASDAAALLGLSAEFAAGGIYGLRPH